MDHGVRDPHCDHCKRALGPLYHHKIVGNRHLPVFTFDFSGPHTLDRFQTLSIGTPITSDQAFMTMFNEQGRIEGGSTLRTDEYGSERLYGPKRYPVFLRMLSKEVDDVMVQKLKPLDVLTSRVPHCSMPAPEAVQVKVTTAYMFSPEVASAYVMASLDAPPRGSSRCCADSRSRCGCAGHGGISCL